MTREEAIKILSELHVQCCDSDSIFNTLDSASRCMAIDMAIDALSDVPDKNVGRWVPCSERLPQEDKNVLVTVFFMGLEQRHKNGWNDHIKPTYYVEIASQIDGEWSSYSDEYKVARSRHKVIAWMELPKPFREDTQ